jgi:hypothetical protein
MTERDQMDERLTLSILAWSIGLLVAVTFVMDAFALAAMPQ